jgi:hypothetical protein
MKIAIATTLVASASAFAPASRTVRTTSLQSSLNGWVPDENAFAWGLPGSLPPVGEFDPLGFAKNTDLQTMKKWREAETQHGRVGMLAALGMLVTEEPIEYHPLFEADNKDIGPAIRHLDEVRAVEPLFFLAFGAFIGALEWNRARTGFSKPEGEFEFQQIEEDYYPGE